MRVLAGIEMAGCACEMAGCASEMTGCASEMAGCGSEMAGCATAGNSWVIKYIRKILRQAGVSNFGL